MDNTKRGPIMRLPTNLGNNKRWKNFTVSTWSRGFHWLSTNSWTTWNFQGRSSNASNATFEEVKIALKRIARPHAFIENEQWNVVCMKEEFHARFAAILQILYYKEWLTYFSNQIAIIFYLANKGQPVN